MPHRYSPYPWSFLAVISISGCCYVRHELYRALVDLSQQWYRRRSQSASIAAVTLWREHSPLLDTHLPMYISG
jgi:hypothetical protein